MSDMPHFALIGAAGYIAPRHLKAIHDTGGRLVAAFDPNDSVGIMDSYFPEAAFFTEFERFDRHLDKIRRMGQAADYVSICSPNYLHDAHIRFALRNGAAVICEKPLVLNARNAEALLEHEQETGKKVNTILQLRLHPALLRLKTAMDAHRGPAKQVDLTYITARGHWYYTSWKGNIQKSGGIATNIGIHFFDMLIWIFGPVVSNTVHLHTHDRAAGHLQLEKANVRWFLSINAQTLPDTPRQAGQRTYRSIAVDGQEIEFSDGFTDLHTRSYEAVLAGNGFGIQEVLPATRLAEAIRGAAPTIEHDANIHPLARLPLHPHPFGI